MGKYEAVIWVTFPFLISRSSAWVDSLTNTLTHCKYSVAMIQWKDLQIYVYMDVRVYLLSVCIYVCTYASICMYVCLYVCAYVCIVCRIMEVIIDLPIGFPINNIISLCRILCMYHCRCSMFLHTVDLWLRVGPMWKGLFYIYMSLSIPPPHAPHATTPLFVSLRSCVRARSHVGAQACGGVCSSSFLCCSLSLSRSLSPFSLSLCLSLNLTLSCSLTISFSVFSSLSLSLSLYRLMF